MADNNEAFDKVKAFFEENAGKVGDGTADATAKAKEFFEANKDKIEEALKSEKAEDISDNVLDSLAGIAKKVFGDEQAEKIDAIRDNLDKRIGND